MREPRHEEEDYGIALAPLIDVLIFLLTFFLVCTSVTRKELDHKLRLPKAEGGAKPEPVPEVLTLNIREDGTVVVNGRLVAPEGLRPLVKAWRAEHAGKPVSIRGDGRVPYEKIMKVMGLCKSVGVTNLDLPVEDPGKDGAGW